jgi:hypothetical protein
MRRAICLSFIVLTVFGQILRVAALEGRALWWFTYPAVVAGFVSPGLVAKADAPPDGPTTDGDDTRWASLRIAPTPEAVPVAHENPRGTAP